MERDDLNRRIDSGEPQMMWKKNEDEEIHLIRMNNVGFRSWLLLLVISLSFLRTPWPWCWGEIKKIVVDLPSNEGEADN